MKEEEKYIAGVGTPTGVYRYGKTWEKVKKMRVILSEVEGISEEELEKSIAVFTKLQPEPIRELLVSEEEFRAHRLVERSKELDLLYGKSRFK